MTYEEYLNLVIQVVTRNTPPDGHLTAAALGALLRQTGETSWKSFGLRTLSDVLRELEARKQLVITQTDKGALAVKPSAAIAGAPAAAPIGPLAFNPLKKAVWDAFVFATPAGRRFMHRANGSVRAGLDAPPEPADEWVEITPITVEMQKAWAEAFLSERAGKFTAAVQAQTNASWSPYAFYTALRSEDESIARQWLRFRSSRVSKEAHRWAIENKLDINAVFERRDRVQPIPRGGLESSSEYLPDNAREMVLLALSQMSTERLMEIPIPAGLLFAALSKIRAR